MADIFLANTIGEELLSGRVYDAIVVSRDDSLNKGRLKIKIPELLSEEDSVWVQSIQPFGGLTIIAIPPEGQEVKVFFNGTIDEGYWFGGNTKNNSIKDPDMVLIADDKNNSITWQRKTGDFKINSIGQVSMISKSKVILKAPDIELDGSVKCTRGASGLITNLNSAIASNGIITQIS